MFYTDNAKVKRLAYYSIMKSDEGTSLEIDAIPMEMNNCAEDAHMKLLSWLTDAFSREEFYGCDLQRIKENTTSTLASTFENPDSFMPHSKLLIEQYMQILEPESLQLIVALVSDILVDDVLCQGLILAAPEDITPYLDEAIADESNTPLIHRGLPLSKLKYGALILDTFRGDGYRISLKQAFGKSVEISMLRNDLLQLKPLSDPFHQTKSYLDMCSGFVKERLNEEPGVNKVDKAEILNKSISYFKNVETFDEQDFMDEVLPDEQMSGAFKQYANSYKTEKQIDLPDSFDISPQAVKKSQRVFKSVLKLDKNFHIYIHGDKNLIQKGAESDGRKFYKIYFEEEK